MRKNFTSIELSVVIVVMSILATMFTYLAAASQPAASATEVTFPSQVQIGNVFTVGEKVEVVAAVATVASVAWTVADYRGVQVDAGTTTVVDHGVRIAQFAVRGDDPLLQGDACGGDAAGEQGRHASR